MEEIENICDKLSNIHQKIVDDIPELKQGLVKCEVCGKKIKVNSAKCLKYGWPECCGYTMILQNLNEKNKF